MVSRNVRRIFCLVAPFAMAVAVRADDFHIKKNMSVEGNTLSSTETWIKGSRERSVGAGMITVRQGDLKKTLTINDQTQTYMVVTDPLDDNAARAAAMATGAPMPAETGGKITVTASIVDTAERKQMFGMQVRHLKVSLSIEPSPDACNKMSQKMEIDGWYADLMKDQKTWSGFRPQAQMAGGCQDKTIIRTSGTGKPGYPLVETITLTNPDGSKTQLKMETTELSKETLDAGLFDVPSGYKQVNTFAEMLPAAAPMQVGMQQGQMSMPSPGNSQNSQAAMMQAMMAAQAQRNGQMGGNGMAPMSGNQMAQMQQAMAMGGQPQPTAASANVPAPKVLGPKVPGKIRVGVAPPDAQVGQGSTAGDYSTPIRNSIVLLMDGPAVEIAALDSRSPIQLQAEAQQKQCDYILFSSVAVKHASSGGFGKMMKMAAPVANTITPLGSMHGMGTAVATQAAASAVQATAQQEAMNQLSGFNTQVKQKDDVTVQYQLIPSGQTTPKLQNNLQAKAKSDGEDVLTPLLQQTVNSVLTEVTKK